MFRHPFAHHIVGDWIQWVFGHTKTPHGGAIKFDLKSSVILSTTALIATVVFILIYLPAKKWKFDRTLGMILVSWYLLVALINLYLE